MATGAVSAIALWTVPTWIASDRGQKKVLVMGEKPTTMGKPSKLKMWHTMLTNKAVGE